MTSFLRGALPPNKKPRSAPAVITVVSTEKVAKLINHSRPEEARWKFCPKPM